MNDIVLSESVINISFGTYYCLKSLKTLVSSLSGSFAVTIEIDRKVRNSINKDRGIQTFQKIIAKWYHTTTIP